MLLATCSYREFTDEMGVPLATTVGNYRAAWPWQRKVQVECLKPYTTFRKMDDKPQHEQKAAYHRYLTSNRQTVLSTMERLFEQFHGQQLVMLCHCDLVRWGTGSCHRRWAAAWFDLEREWDVPELGAKPTVCPLCGVKVPLPGVRCARCIRLGAQGSLL